MLFLYQTYIKQSVAMKKIGFLVISLLLPLAMNAQQEEDDFPTL